MWIDKNECSISFFLFLLKNVNSSFDAEIIEENCEKKCIALACVERTIKLPVHPDSLYLPKGMYKFALVYDDEKSLFYASCIV